MKKTCLKTISFLLSFLCLSDIIEAESAYPGIIPYDPILANGASGSDSIIPDFREWTKEEIKHYSDSLMHMMYPPLEIMRTDTVTDADDDPDSDKRPSKAPVINSHVPDIVAPDKGKSVGEIPVSSGLSPMGAKTYDIPIKAYPGINGMTPRLSIHYDSHAGASEFGYGWSLSGLSKITRGHQTIHYDGKTESISLGNSDSFYLDGMRLIKIGTETGCILFETESGNIKAKGYVSGDVMKYFEVFYPDGKKGIFGLVSNSISRLDYPMSKISDLHGNAIEYRYMDSDNRSYIIGVMYNGSAMINFSYEDSPTPITAFIAGKQIVRKKRLTKIMSQFGSAKLGDYSFKYILYNNRSLLSEVGFSNGSNSLNPLRFYYGEGAVASRMDKSETKLTEWYKSNSDNPALIRTVKGKIDYTSGMEGLIVFPNYNPYWEQTYYDSRTKSNYRIYTSAYKGDEKIFIYNGLNGSTYADVLPSLTTGSGFVDVICADLTGKQEEYIIKINNTVESSREKVVFSIFGTSSTYGIVKIYDRTFDLGAAFSRNGMSSVHPKHYCTGDFNGDGKMEIMAVSADNPFLDNAHPTQYYIFDLEGNRILHQGSGLKYKVSFLGVSQTNGQTAYNNSDKLIPMDFDGDGKTDICIIGESGTEVCTFESSGSSLMSKSLVSYNGLTRSMAADRNLLCGEFNGDGLNDLLVSTRPGFTTDKDWTLFLSKGDGTFLKSTFSGPTLATYDYSGYLLQDIDCDGLTDLVAYDKTGFNYYRWTGSSFTSTSTRVTPAKAGFNLVPTNIVSRHSFSQITVLKDNSACQYSWSVNSGRQILATGMANSLGVVEKNSYGLLDGSADSPLTFRAGAIYPYVNIMEPIPVLVSTEKYAGGEAVDNVSYRYENAVIHRQGLGFRGFGKIFITDKKGHIRTKTYDPYRYCILTGDSSPTESYTYTYSVTVSPDKRVKTNLTGKTEKNLLTGHSVTTSLTYDSYGYPTQETVTYSDGLTVKTVNTYQSSAGVADGYNLGYLTDRTVTYTRNGTTVTEREQMPSHSKRQPLKSKSFVNGNQILENTYTYDQKGNTLSVTEKKYSSTTGLTTSMEYDTYGRLRKETDILGLITEYTYGSDGGISSEKDPRGGMTKYVHDSFGREISVSRPDNTKDSVAYTWDSSTTDGLYSIKKFTTGDPDIYEIYDPLGREVRKTDIRFDGISRHIDMQYDQYGRLYKRSQPHMESDPSSWETYSYDVYDRVIKIVESTQKITTRTYSGADVTETKDGVSITRSYDPRGNIVSSKDETGTMTFTLAPDDQIDAVDLPDGQTVSVGYDTYRRQSSLSDPSSGTTLYEYDSTGNLSKETDANGKSISYLYDGYNRILKKTFEEFNTSYKYSAYGEIAEETSTNGTSTKTEYDGYGRILSVAYTAPDIESFKKIYSYENGNIKSVAYYVGANKLASEDMVYANGHLKTISLNGTAKIYSIVEENSLGQLTRLDCGPTREYRYTDHGIPSGRKAWVKTQQRADTLLSHSYVFNPGKSDMSSRTDNVYGKTEFFSYDGLRRLVAYGGNAVTYDDNGNITCKEDVGTFSYNHPTKPYALTSMTATGSLKPSTTQTVEYTSFGRASRISENGTTAEITYNADGERVRMTVRKAGSVSHELVKYYLGGNYEREKKKDGTVIERLYLGGDYYSSPVVLIKTGTEVKRYYIIRDILGSICSVVNPDYTIAQEMGYDAWGNLRNPSTGKVYSNLAPELFLGRGYTGHEHLPWFRLINMNARLYDPLLSRFLSPDPLVQMPDFSQNYNRYSYCLNNPMTYVDENGEFFWLAIGISALISGVTNVAVHWNEISAAGGWKGFWKGAGYFGIGAVAGGAGAAAGIGAAVGITHLLSTTISGVALYSCGILPGAAVGAASGAAEGFIGGTLNSLYEGYGFKHSLKDGAEGALLGAVTGAIAGGVDGGTRAYQSYRNIWNGRTTNKSAVYDAGAYANGKIKGSGRFVGKAKHNLAENVLERAQGREIVNGLVFEKRIQHNGYWIIPDVLYVGDDMKKIIYDFKFGYANRSIAQFMRTRQMRRYREFANEVYVFKY